MKQVLQNRSGLTVVRDVPAPPCPPGSLLVRNAYSVISSGTERSRVALSQKSLLEKARERPDLVREVADRARREGVRNTRDAVKRKLEEETAVGYSSAGTVIEVGGTVSGFEPGDVVACAGGGHANHAEIVSVPANLCALVPDGVPLPAAALTTIAAIALHGARLAGTTLGDRVAVVGCGLVGQIACRLTRASGAEVFALDVDATRVDAALAGGAHHGFRADSDAERHVLDATAGLGVDAVLVTAASRSPAPLLTAAHLLRDRGTLILVGDVPVELPRSLLYEKELSFRVSRSYGPGRYDAEYEERGLDYPIGYVRWTEQRNMAAVLELQARGVLRLDDLVEVVPVDDAAQAYDRIVGPSERRPRGAIALAYGATTELERSARPPLGVAAPAGQAAHATAAPVRIGLIGPGSFASRVLVPALTAAGARLEVVGGGSGPSAAAAVRSLGFARTADSADAIIDDDGVDAVVVATRHGSHAALTARALAAGKHVFCEKPLALSVDELDAVAAAAGSARGILAVGFNRRFAPTLVELRDFVSTGGGRTAAVYRVSAGHLPAEHWTHDLEQGGGRLLGEACHFVDSLRFIVGNDVTSVHAGGYGAPTLPIQARDNVVVTLAFADGSVGSIVYVSDGSGRVAKERVEVFSGSRTAILDDFRTLELFDERRVERRRQRVQDKGHRAELAAFVHGVERGAPPVPLNEVANVSLATLAILESLKTGLPVAVGRP